MVSIIFSKTVNDCVASENTVNDKFAIEHQKTLNTCLSLSDYLSKSNAPVEYAPLMKRLPAKTLRILDIGVGRGESSLFLASCGHTVFAVEPSPGFCSLIEAAANKFGLNLTVCQGVAEDINLLKQEPFDVVFFYGSLHHCDDPRRALKNSYNILKEDGIILVMSELIIKPWHSKRHFNKLMKTKPIEMGNYGGNEHPYHNWEYVKFLRQAGFVNILTFPMSISFSPLDRLQDILAMRNKGQRMYNKKRFFIVVIYYYLLAIIVRNKFLFYLFSHASIVAGHYIGKKCSLFSKTNSSKTPRPEA